MSNKISQKNKLKLLQLAINLAGHAGSIGGQVKNFKAVKKAYRSLSKLAGFN
jgi:hypothetical protein